MSFIGVYNGWVVIVRSHDAQRAMDGPCYRPRVLSARRVDVRGYICKPQPKMSQPKLTDYPTYFV